MLWPKLVIHYHWSRTWHFYLAHSRMPCSLCCGSIVMYHSLAIYSRCDSMLEVMCKLHDIRQDFLSLMNWVYFICQKGFQALWHSKYDFHGVYLCLIFETSIWKFITNLKKIRFQNKRDFLSSSNLIFAGYTGSKNQVRT